MSILNKLNKDMPILLVDDYPPARQSMKNCFRQLGFNNIIEAADGEVALEKLQSGEYKLIVSDWNMPNMTGVDFFNALCKDDKMKKIPFLMVTAEGKRENILEAREAGVTHHIVKPFNTENLGSLLEDLFQKHKNAEHSVED